MSTSRWSAFLDGRKVVLIDGAVDGRTIHRVAAAIAALPFARTEIDDEDVAPSARTAVAEIPSLMLAVEPLFAILHRVATDEFGPALPPVSRAYVNRMETSDIAFPHRDCAVTREDVTVLYYANVEWERAWGGETIFFDDDGDARLAVAPRPGRIAAFSGAIEHRVGIPLNGCPVSRFTLAYKLGKP